MKQVPKTWSRAAWLAAALLAVSLRAAPSAAEDDLPAPAASPVPEAPSEVVIVGTSAIPGTAIEASKIPGNVQTLRAEDIAREGQPSLLGALNSQASSINVNDDLDDPFQPDILYHGFEASPLVGVSSGLAVYQNGVRVNEPFGDVVNWDLIPDMAIDRVDLIDSNPVYGLNALGGALSVTMKNGFTFTGADADYAFGSFRRSSVEGEAGANNGTFAVYAGVRELHQDGWRFFASDAVHQYYLALSAKSDRGSLELSYTRANNTFFGQGAAPVQSLAIGTEETFTGPQGYQNNLNFVSLNGSYKLADQLALQGTLYYRDFHQFVPNGDDSDFTACTQPRLTRYLCQADGLTPLTDPSGSFLPDITQGGTVLIGQNDFELVATAGEGGSLQLSDSRAIAGHDNQLTVGVAVDTSHVMFQSGTQVGLLTPQLLVQPSTQLVVTPESEESGGISATPVGLSATNNQQGYYLTDTYSLTPRLALTASGRYNAAQVDLSDHNGTNLSGKNRYTHFNPALGATYALSPNVNAFAGWAVNNRAPTASEIECSNPLQPCLLPAALAGDPPTLKQVIAHSYELGLRGSFTDGGNGRFNWNASAFRTDSDDDIYAISTSLSSGFFQNIGATRRQGLDASLSYRSRGFSAYAQYSYVDATFQSGFAAYSPNNPFADADGNIQITPGDRLPGIPAHRFKAGVELQLLAGWAAGVTVSIVSPQYFKGDESNQNSELPGYHVFGLHSTYQIGDHLEVFAAVENLLNARYSTFGIYSDPTGIGAPGVPADADTNGPGVDNRFESPAAPLNFFAGVRLRL
jgi:iron complex outermembrane receptor protein